MHIPDKFALSGLFAALLAVPAQGMESPAPAAEIEEIEVIGQRNLLALRMQVEQAQDEVHLLFNELNTDDDFDIVCKLEERIFSRMREKNCMPQYAWDARAKEGRAFAQRRAGETPAEDMPAELEIQAQGPALREQMIEALRHSPELFDAIVKHATLLEELKKAQATYFGEEDQERAR